MVYVGLPLLIIVCRNRVHSTLLHEISRGLIQQSTPVLTAFFSFFFNACISTGFFFLPSGPFSFYNLWPTTELPGKLVRDLQHQPMKCEEIIQRSTTRSGSTIISVALLPMREVTSKWWLAVDSRRGPQEMPIQQPVMASSEIFTIGSHVKVVTSTKKEWKGEVVAFDYDTKTLMLSILSASGLNLKVGWYSRENLTKYKRQTISTSATTA